MQRRMAPRTCRKPPQRIAMQHAFARRAGAAAASSATISSVMELAIESANGGFICSGGSAHAQGSRRQHCAMSAPDAAADVRDMEVEAVRLSASEGAADVRVWKSRRCGCRLRKVPRTCGCGVTARAHIHVRTRYRGHPWPLPRHTRTSTASACLYLLT